MLSSAGLKAAGKVGRQLRANMCYREGHNRRVSALGARGIVLGWSSGGC
jgi:hypothetical protein